MTSNKAPLSTHRVLWLSTQQPTTGVSLPVDVEPATTPPCVAFALAFFPGLLYHLFDLLPSAPLVSAPSFVSSPPLPVPDCHHGPQWSWQTSLALLRNRERR